MTTQRRSRAKPAPARTRRGKPSRRETGEPVFLDLSAAEAVRVLRRNSVGRIAYALHDFVEVQPVHYVADGRWLYVRTSPGIKVDVLRRNRWVAFEVDEIEGVFAWRSVLARGTAYVLSAESTPDLAKRYARAVRKLREFLPETLTPHDPVPFRTLVLGIYVEALTGRKATQP